MLTPATSEADSEGGSYNKISLLGPLKFKTTPLFKSSVLLLSNGFFLIIQYLILRLPL